MKKKDIETLENNPQFNSADFCNLCGITRDHLRTWIKHNCIYYKINTDNNYHIYDMEYSFLDVCNIKSLQRMGFSLKEIGSLPNMSPEQLISLFEQKKVSVLKLLESIQNSLKKMDDTINAAKKTQYFNANANTILKDFPYDYVYSINTNDKKLLNKCLQNEFCATTVNPILKSTNDKTNQNVFFEGIASTTKHDSPLIWQKDDKSRFFNTIIYQVKKNNSTPKNTTFIHTLLINNTVLDLAPNREAAKNFDYSKQPDDIIKLIDILQKLGYVIKNVLFCHLTKVMVNGENRSYFDMYIEF